MTHVRTIPDFSQPVSVSCQAVVVTGRRRLSADGRFLNLPNEPVPGTVEAWEVVTPVRPDTAHSRSLRFLDIAGETLAAVSIIAGGMVLTGLATLI